MNLAIIPARGGSKRIPHKNIRYFLGKPIIAYSILSAIRSEIFDEVMVSTDSNEIAEIAKEYGAVIPFMRSDIASDDYSTTADVLLEVLSNYKRRGKTFDRLCCIYPTAPFVTPEKLCAAYRLLLQQYTDAIIPVVAFSYPPLRGLVLDDSFVKLKWPENLNTRSQDLEAIYHDCGQFYFVRTEAFLNEKTLLCKKTVPMILSENEVQDIDNEIDWKLAELKYRLIVNSCIDYDKVNDTRDLGER